MKQQNQSESETVRCFIAIAVEGAILDRLTALSEKLRPHFGGRAFRWAHRRQMHLTLRFLGDMPVAEVEGLKRALGEACRPVTPFTLRAEGLGCFPHSARPRVLWVGVQGAVEPLAELHRLINLHTAGWGEPVENRPFQPHLTLARAKEVQPQDVRQLERLLREYDHRAWGDWEVKEVCLMKSELRREGAQYTELAAIPLATAGA